MTEISDIVEEIYANTTVHKISVDGNRYSKWYVAVLHLIFSEFDRDFKSIKEAQDFLKDHNEGCSYGFVQKRFCVHPKKLSSIPIGRFAEYYKYLSDDTINLIKRILTVYTPKRLQ